MKTISKIRNTGYFESGYFLLKDSRELVQWQNNSELLVTMPHNHQIKESLISMINSAKKFIKICSFILTDEEIYLTIRRNLIERDLVVFILTQIDSSRINTSFLTEEECSESRGQTHLSIIGDLFSNGAHIRASEDMHAKFFLVDGVSGFLTSANITTPSMVLNCETGIILKDKKEVSSLEFLFDKIFIYGTSYRQFVKTSDSNRFIKFESPTIDHSVLETMDLKKLRFTYKSSIRGIYNQLITIIDTANKFLFLSSYSIVKLSAIPEFLESVSAAVLRGVDVKIFCRGMNYRYDHMLGVKSLHSLGCEIYGDNYNHSKGVLNENEGMIFTANLDGNHGLISGFEVGCILNKKQYKAFLNFSKWQIENALYKYESIPKKEDVYKSYKFYLKERKIRPKKLPKKIDVKTSNEKLAINIGEFPVYTLYDRKDLVGLSVNGINYKCYLEGKTIVVGDEIKYWRGTTYMFMYDEINVMS